MHVFIDNFFLKNILLFFTEFFPSIGNYKFGYSKCGVF